MTERPDGVRAVVAAHASLADALVAAVDQITGRGALFATVSNVGLGAAALQEAVAARLAETGARVLFTDLPAGSCCMAARRLQREDPSLTVVTGANLATLLDFAMGEGVATGGGEATDTAWRAVARAAAARGRETLVVSGD
jgi:PTS system N-acetylgalactosamine-specific IIA component